MKGRAPIPTPGGLPCAIAGKSANGAYDATARQDASVASDWKGIAMGSRRKYFLSACLALLAAGSAVPVSWAGDDARALSYKEQVILNSQTFLDAHPDMKYRKSGWEAYERQDYLAARGEFVKSARYGDKASQAMLAEMSWKGQGGPTDRAMAYIWADLAAERGYPHFLALREQYWKALDTEERSAVANRGLALLQEYGDAVTTDRLSHHLRKHVQRIQFSSMTAAPPKEVNVIDYHGNPVRIDGNKFYSPAFWDPVKYRAWQDAQWKNPPSSGKVDVGDVEPVRPTRK